MTPTPDQALAGWRTLPDRETWDAHVARGGVWQSRTRSGVGQCYGVQRFVQPGRRSCLFRPVDPHTGNYWPMPGAVPTEPGLWERRDRAVPVSVRIERDFVGHDGDLGPEYLAWLSDHNLDGSSVWSAVTPDGQWISPYVKTRG